MPLLERMTLAEKIGQMTQADLGYLRDLSPIAELHLGSVLSGGNADPPAGNTPTDVDRHLQRLPTQSARRHGSACR